MRTLPRKMRAFRPATDALEARNAVSSLSPWIAVAATGAGIATTSLRRPTTEFSGSGFANRVVDAQVAPQAAVRRTSTAVGAPGVPADVSSSAGRRSPGAMAPGLAANFPASPFSASVITLSQPVAPSSPHTGGVPQSFGGGSPASIPVTRPSVTAAPSVDGANDGVRPMMLAATTSSLQAASFGSTAPTDTATSPAAATNVGSGSGGVGRTMGAGSGGVPIISNSNFPLVDDGVGGDGVHRYHAGNDYLDSKNVIHHLAPVGASARFTVFTPGGSVYPVATSTFAWTGGSNYQNYFGSLSDGVEPKAVKTTPPGTATDTYSFIVDATERAYTVDITVTSTNQQYSGGACEVTFESERPKPATLSPTAGIMSFTSNATSATVALSTPITISASVKTGNFGGYFMFMQIINSTRRSYIDDTNHALHRANDLISPVSPYENFNGPINDDYDGTTQSVGYPYTYNGQLSRGWQLNFGESMPSMIGTPPPSAPVMNDGPQFGLPATYNAVKTDDSFSTYLMYRPLFSPWNGQWIALAQVDWSWSLTAIKPMNRNWPANYTTPQPTPVIAAVPSGGREFPFWVNTGKNYTSNLLNPYQPGI